jgi:hypothetical protein
MKIPHWPFKSTIYLLVEKKISKDDDSSKIDLNQADHQKVAEMIENNRLGIHKVGIYSLKMTQKSFVFIYASSEKEAIECYTQSFHKPPLNCHEYPLEFEVTKGNGFISFRDMRKEFESFPAIAG